MPRSILLAQVVCALLYAGPLCAAPPPPPPVAGAVGQAPAPSVEPVEMAASRPRLAAPLSCSPEKSAEELPPGERLACLEKMVADSGAETLVERALALESAGLVQAAALSWRKMSTAGLCDVGVEAGRRANALAELERARVSSLKRGGRAAKAAFRSSLQTLNRQARARQ